MPSTRLLFLPVTRLLLICKLGDLHVITAISKKSVVGPASLRLKPPTDVAGRLLDWNSPFENLRETARFGGETMKPNPLNDIILLLGHPRADRAQFLLGYSHYFYDVWYIKSSEKQDALGEGCTGSEDMRCISDQIPKLGKVVESLIQQTQLDATSIKGLMYLHFDFFFNPAVLAAHPLDLMKIWRPRRGLERYGVILDNKCLKGQELLDSHEGSDEEHWKNGDGSGGWFPAPCPAPETPGWCHMKPDLMATVKQITSNKILGSAGWAPDELCYGWADIFYLPVAGFAAYKTLSGSFANGFHESAVPTMLAMIVRSKQVPGEEILDCWGCCQSCSANRSVIFSNLCGHKVDLSRAEHQVAMVDMLAGQSGVGASLVRKAYEIDHVGAIKDLMRPALYRASMQDTDSFDVEGAGEDFKNPAAFGRLQAGSAVRRESEVVDRFSETAAIGDLHLLRKVL